MTNQDTVHDQSICHRKEPRFKTSEENRLQCETTLAKCGLRRGSVIDLSRSGVRLICEGSYKAGQPIFTELTTDRSHGIYKGVIRRVEPWVGGQSILGCSLDDPIPESVLKELANEGIVNRRSDDRIDLSQAAKMSWPLSQEEINVELIDLSPGGMKIISSAPIPDDVRLRFRLDLRSDQDLIVEAKSVWVEPSYDGCIAGVAFSHEDSPKRLAQALGIDISHISNRQPENLEESIGRQSSLRPSSVEPSSVEPESVEPRRTGPENVGPRRVEPASVGRKHVVYAAAIAAVAVAVALTLI